MTPPSTQSARFQWRVRAQLRDGTVETHATTEEDAYPTYKTALASDDVVAAFIERQDSAWTIEVSSAHG